MGLQNGRLRHSQMTASSQWDKYHAAFLARLQRARHGRYFGSWCARMNNRYQYLQIDFTRPSKIIKIATQGRQDGNQWVTQYYVTHSVNAINFVEYKERNNRKVMKVVLYMASWFYEFLLADRKSAHRERTQRVITGPHGPRGGSSLLRAFAFCKGLHNINKVMEL